MSLDCLVINLTRFGDLLQSQPLLHDLASQGYSTGLICLENFAGTLPLLRHVDAHYSLAGAALLHTLDHDWQLACHKLLDFTRAIREQSNAKYVINLTSTISSRLFSNLLRSPKSSLYGFGLDEEGFGVNHGAWSTFLCGTTLCRHNSVFNIADMFRRLGQAISHKEALPKEKGLAPPKASHALEPFFEKLPSHNGLIAFQLGASEERRQWAIENFADLGDILWEKAKLLPVLTGTRGEATLAALYAKKTKSPHLNLIGQTDLQNLAALLTCVRLLITNDTGTLHLAAGLGTPSVSFFLSTAQPWDTGPYLPNCLCLEPDLPCHPCAFQSQCPHGYACRNAIQPSLVAEEILHFIEHGNWLPKEESGSRIWQTAQDAFDFADLISLSEHASHDRTLWIRHQRNFWRHFLGELSGEKEKKKSTSLSPCSPAFQDSILPTLEQVHRILVLLREQIPLLSASPQAGKVFLRNCERIQALLTEKDLLSFGYFWRELRMDHGQNLGSLEEIIATFERNLQSLLSDIQIGTDCA